MIAGLLIDLLVVAAVAAFAWAGRELGSVASLGRAIASAAAFAAAVLLRDPVGGIFRALLGMSVDLSRLLAMLAVGAGGYFAATRLLAWWRARRAGSADDEGAGSDVVAIGSGAALGLAWALVFVAMLVLLPASTIVSRAAASSLTGSMLVWQESGLRWLREGFPHYTQTLPKDRDGYVVGEQERIHLQGDVDPRAAPRDAELLLGVINRARSRRSVQALAYNPDVGEVAQRHALSLASEATLSYRSPGGGALDPRVQAALGESAGAFRPEAGIEVVWAHGPANAAQGVVRDSRAADLVHDPQWSEVGIGVADAGWFNGRIYVVLLVGPVGGEADVEAPAASATTGDAAGIDPFTGAPDTAPGASTPGLDPEEPALG